MFTPDEGATSDVADADYLHYGFWLRRTTDEDGVLTYNEVQTFAGSSIAATTAALRSVTGSATYDGGAVGVYVINNEYDVDTGVVVDATSGHFQADASLMATFGQVNDDQDEGTIGLTNQLNTITGTIDNFVLQHGEANTWSVALDGDITQNAGTASGTANGGVMGQDGSFSATFHGPVAQVDHDMDPGTDPDIEAPQPHTVVGEFNANFGNGSAAGGFGARTK